ncbi:MAG: sirohydrochlorin cobaltochelatase [Planctomycetaceae bacterium]|nr:MAG: sirohydrochlorin cobaltochelatase [Planctomycetaceae bacterium]
MSYTEQTAVVVIAHGSRREAANRDALLVAQQLAAEGVYHPCCAAYLELAKPTIEQAALQCVSCGATRVLLLPYFLSAGAHVTEDLQQHRQQLSEMYPQVSFELCPPLGWHPLMLQIVKERLAQRLENASECEASVLPELTEGG